MVADEVDDFQDLAVGGLAQAAAELLEPDDPRLRGPEHQDGVQLREVQAFVEDVHGADDVELARGQHLQGLRAGRRRFAGVDGDGAAAVIAQVRGHEVGMALRDAEGQDPAAAARVELLEGVRRSRVHGEPGGDRLLVEPRVAPGDVRVVHLVREP